MSKITLGSQNVVAETLLTTLYARAVEAQHPTPLLRDDQAVALVERIDYDFSRFKFRGPDSVGIILRAREFDRRTRGFLDLHSNAVVVNVGCGLDTRFSRIDNGQVEWYDLDLPEVVDLRRKLLPETSRSHLLGGSVFEESWLKSVNTQAGRPFLFLAEGVLPYFTEAQVKGLVQMLKNQFPGSELVSDTMTPFMVWLHNLELALSPVRARLQWGLKHGRDVESWSPGIRLLDEWFYFDRPEPRLGIYQWMRYLPPLAKGVGIFHYRLGEPPVTPDSGWGAPSLVQSSA